MSTAFSRRKLLFAGLWLTAAAAEWAALRPVVFQEHEFNEAELARRTAQRFRTRHQELALSGDEMLARLGEAVGAFDQPSMDGVNSYFVSWAARQAGLKVALSGLGGDEIFGGYSTFRWTPKAKSVAVLARRVPVGVRSVMASAAEKISEHLNSKDAHRKMENELLLSRGILPRDVGPPKQSPGWRPAPRTEPNVALEPRRQ